MQDELEVQEMQPGAQGWHWLVPLRKEPVMHASQMLLLEELQVKQAGGQGLQLLLEVSMT